MERDEALKKLKDLEGCDLRCLADKYEVTVWKNGKLNKGWAGHVIERFLSLPLNSSKAPNFGSWELKLTSIKRPKKGAFVPKETMAVGMLDPVEVKDKEFEQSHVFIKLKKMVVCIRIYESKDEKSSALFKTIPFDLESSPLYEQIKCDYNTIRDALLEGKPLESEMGVFLQPRTKGPGHGSTSRAFYLRKTFVARIAGLDWNPPPPKSRRKV